MNEKGQTLVVFVILLPILLLLGIFFVDEGTLLGKKNRLNEIADDACRTLAMTEDVNIVLNLLYQNEPNLKQVVVATEPRLTISFESDVSMVFQKDQKIRIQRKCEK